MGLPSGTKWARYDIDVTQPDNFCASEFQYEKSFFSWANVQAYNPTNGSFINVYDWGSVNAEEPWFSGQPYGETPGAERRSNIPKNGTYDAAVNILGEPWHLPTAEQWAELIDNIDYLNSDGTIKNVSATDKRSTVNGVVGIWVQSKINGNRLFFACSGYGEGTSLNSRTLAGNYWSATYRSEKNAASISFGITSVNAQYFQSRAHGLSIRPVQD